ncbi:MAG: hypothetical protein H6Q19_761 [Bacteroidetes bacterium]|nr:hypothetical protein [Bacteroidota bacterium]
MKHFFLLLMMSVLAVNTYSQIQATGNYTVYNEATGLDYIYIFSPIDNAAEIHYTTTENTNSVKWYTFLDGVKTEMTSVSIVSPTETYIDPKNNTGYIINVNGKDVARFWVFDYSQYLPAFTSISATDGEIPCENILLNLTGNLPEFNYQNTTGGIFSIDRYFDIEYNTLEWDKDKKEWKVIKHTEEVKKPSPLIAVPTPFTKTTFTLKGDQFTSLLNIPEISLTSAEYETKAVKCNITSITTTRDEKNENDRPEKETDIEGSAPLDIQFSSNPTPNVRSYFWTIYRNGEKLMARSEKDHLYTFSKAGNYKIELNVTNGICTDSSSVNVIVMESSIIAPAVFTPNNDGYNEEFRVAYRSIIEYHCTVYNRWGRVVYTSSDPAKGWNGTIGGKPAAEGTYFYIVNARGSDDKVYKLKGHVNLLR